MRIIAEVDDVRIVQFDGICLLASELSYVEKRVEEIKAMGFGTDIEGWVASAIAARIEYEKRNKMFPSLAL